LPNLSLIYLLYFSPAIHQLMLSGSFNYFKAHGCSELLRAESVPQLMQQLLTSLMSSFTINGKPAGHLVEALLCSVYCR